MLPNMSMPAVVMAWSLLALPAHVGCTEQHDIAQHLQCCCQQRCMRCHLSIQSVFMPAQLLQDANGCWAVHLLRCWHARSEGRQVNCPRCCELWHCPAAPAQPGCHQTPAGAHAALSHPPAPSQAPPAPVRGQLLVSGGSCGVKHVPYHIMLQHAELTLSIEGKSQHRYACWLI